MASLGEIIGGFSGGKSRLLLYSGVVVVIGMLLNAGEWLKPSDAINDRPAEVSTRSNWIEGGVVNKADIKERADRWGDAAIRLGLSFMIAMILASLLRAFFKTMLTLAVVVVGVVWFMHSRGMVEPFWDPWLASLEDLKNWGMSNTNTIKEFFQGYVPSVAAALVGFGFGLRR